MDRVNRKDVTDAPFDVVLRGYDKRQVDERLRFLSSQLTAAENSLRVATQRVAELQDEVNEARAMSGGWLQGDSTFGARVEKILTLAQEEAREVRTQADAAAATLVEQAQKEAADQRQRIEQDIAAWQARAHAEADQIRQAVAHEADELFKTARADANEICKAARAEAERLVAAATDAAARRERSSAHELNQLSRLQQEINSDLYRAKEVLDKLFGATGAAVRATSGPMAEVITETPAETMLPARRTDGAQPAR